MKRIILLGAITLLSYNAFAQTEMGSVIISGNVGYTTTNNTYTVNVNSATTAADMTPVPNNTTNTFTASADAGFFIVRNLAIGVNFTYSNTVTPEKYESSNIYYTWNNTVNTMQIGPFIEDFMSITERFFFTSTLNANYQTGTSNASAYVTGVNGGYMTYPQETTTGYNFALAPGLAFFPSHCWAITFKLNNLVSYTNTKSTDAPFSTANDVPAIVTESANSNSLHVGVGLVPTLGISFVFGCRAKTDNPPPATTTPQ